jgi:hypothetical protein
MNRVFHLIALTYFLLTIQTVQGQVFSDYLNINDSTQVHILSTVRGDVFFGHVTKISGTQLVFLLENKIPLSFAFKEIKSVLVKGEDLLISKPLRQKKIPKGRMVGRDSFPIQTMIYSYTAFALQKGSLLYTNFDVIWNSVDWGITDQFTGGVALYLINVVILRGKLTTEVYDNVRVGLGTKFIAFFPDLDEFGILTNFSGIVSIGTPERFFSINGGVFVPVGGVGSRAYGGGIGFGGERKKFTYRGELYILSSRLSRKNYQPVLSPELVIGFKQQHRRYEAGVILLPWTDFPIIPYLGFKAHF